MTHNTVVLGLGSNLGDRLATFQRAIKLLSSGTDPILSETRASEVFESEALLLPNSPSTWNIPFFNIAISGRTHLSPPELLLAVKKVEKELGRQQRERWAPREVDIDILVYGEERVDLPQLQVPHPALTERPFALWPLAALIPGYRRSAMKWGVNRCEIPCRTWRAPHEIQSIFLGHMKELSIPVVKGPLPATELLGILNITPDSFSDGGLFKDPAQAALHARELFNYGASILDLGAESTRPGATPISATEEWARLEPVLQCINKSFSTESLRPTISIDTRNPMVAQLALRNSADWINDVTGMNNPKMREVVAQAGCTVVAMHSLSIPPSKDLVLDQEISVIDQLLEWGQQTITQLVSSGIAREKIIIDPGVGFGKTARQSLEIVLRAEELLALNTRILIGHSRKSFLSLFSDRPFAERDSETAVISSFLEQRGIHYLRLHNIELNSRFRGLHCNYSPPFCT